MLFRVKKSRTADEMGFGRFRKVFQNGRMLKTYPAGTCSEAGQQANLLVKVNGIHTHKVINIHAFFLNRFVFSANTNCIFLFR